MTDSTPRAHPALVDYHAGLDYLNRGRFLESIQRFRRCVEKDPEFLDAHFRLACAYRRIGDYAHAWESLTVCARLSPRDVEIVKESADAALFLANGPEAVRLAEQWSLLAPRDAVARSRRVLVVHQFEGARKALRLVEKILREKPRWVDGYYYQGHLLEMTGDPAAAEDAYSKALEFDPNRSRTLDDLRRLWRGISAEENPLRTETARIFLDECDRLLRAGLTDQGLRAVEKWRELFPDQAKLLERVVEARLQREQYEEALKAVDSTPKHLFTLRLHFLRGKVLAASGRAAEAAEVYRALRTEEPRSEEAWAGEIESLLELDDARGAAQTAALAVAKLPDRPQLWFLLAAVAGHSGSSAQILAALEKTVALDPDHEPALFALGIERLKAGDPEGAVRPLRDLVSLNEQHLEGRRHLAIAYTAAQSWAEALESWREVLRLEPTDPQALRNAPRIESFLRQAPPSEKSTESAEQRAS